MRLIIIKHKNTRQCFILKEVNLKAHNYKKNNYKTKHNNSALNNISSKFNNPNKEKSVSKR